MSQDAFVFHLERPGQSFNVMEAAIAVARANGRSPFGQAADLLRLRRGPGKLEADEYYAFRLWDRTRFGPAEAAAKL